jgi:hypothetical protein
VIMVFPLEISGSFALRPTGTAFTVSIQPPFLYEDAD